MFVLSGITLLSRLLGFVREQILASTLGATYAADAFVAAQLVPTALDAIVGTAMATALLPLLTAAKNREDNELARLYRAATLALGAGYLAETILLYWQAPAVMATLAPGLPDHARAQAVTLARILAPAPLLLGLASLHTMLLHTHSRFWIPAAAALGPNVAVVISCLVLRQGTTAHTIAWALVAGYTAQVTLLVLAALRLRIPWRTDRPDWAAVSRAAALALPLMASSALGQTTSFVDKFLASHMREGTIASLNYALKLVQLPVGVIIQGLAQVMFARFAHFAAAGDRDTLTAELARTLRLLLFVFLPGVGLLVVLSEPAVATAFQRGRFDSQATQLTAQAMTAYAPAVLPLSIVPLLTNVANALQLTKLPLLGTSVATVAYVTLAVTLAPFLAHRGLALAWALAQMSAMLVLAWAVTRHLGPTPMRAAAAAVPPNLAATAAASLAAWATSRSVEAALVKLTLGALAGGGAWLLVHGLLRTPELSWGMAVVQGVLKRRPLYRHRPSV